jgi:radical SAM protein (TIGR01212 family)
MPAIISRYNRFSDFLRSRYGARIRRVSVNAGFSCPNLDGTISKDGCIFCSNKAFSKNNSAVPIEEQIRTGIVSARKKYGAEKFILYFQSFSNTYGTPAQLKEKYDFVLNHPEFVCLCIGTRPDCIDEERVSLLSSYQGKSDVWVELGLQSVHNKTLEAINRGHDFAAFVRAAELLAARKIEVFAHVIIGLPGEGEREIIDTATALSTLPVTGVKIHPLHIVKETKLEEMYKTNKYSPMTRTDYIDLLIKFLEHLRKDIVIVRVTADVLGDMLIAPEWINDKSGLLKTLDDEMEKRNTFQGVKAESRNRTNFCEKSGSCF